MKKLISLCLALMLVVGLCSTASATTFTKSVQCTDPDGAYAKTDLSAVMEFCNHKIYVNYNAQGCSNSYTNHFRGYAQNDIYINDKWVTPGGGYYIQGSGFCEDWRYYLTMRGNTKYYENEGLTRVVLSGWFDPNR